MFVKKKSFEKVILTGKSVTIYQFYKWSRIVVILGSYRNGK